MSDMTPRQRFKLALEHKETDRIPIDFGGPLTSISPGAYWALHSVIGGLEHSIQVDRAWRVVSNPSEEILRRLFVDTRYITLGASKEWDYRDEGDGIFYDPFGIVWEEGDRHCRMLRHPLSEAKSIREIERYRFPDPLDDGLYKGIEAKAWALFQKGIYALVPRYVGTIFELSWYLRGFEQFFNDLVLNTSMAEALLERVTDFQIQVFGEILKRIGRFIDLVILGDDIGSQGGPLISPKLYRKIVKPRQKRLIQFIKSHTTAYVFYHSCGSIREFIPDLVEIGVDLLHPVQPTAVGMSDFLDLKRKFGSNISFAGGIDQQHLLPRGKPSELVAMCRNIFSSLGVSGGYVFCAGHNIQDDVPAENILVIFDEAAKYNPG